ncbi:hypothetical protein MJO29_014960 [Puccinia striiformis f. sp. tritici]|uniref:hypothetical protein n=1 Tax=Puccinia striiformis f. sp. tritici TaxID=168172 RepID=UPI0020084EE0|nr:hypothetical protein Pst134EA_028028 [Puccinia striiformis f. sp. tritici]KAH9448735.1 hypothetical protein Pst134EA_028028 [Puccinia striiformis f. sp. tritici]KAI7937645.1 hypothetical protein MJO29_014960 [Puccinia striiformis f. sp. tritici]
MLIGPLFTPKQLEELFISQKPNLELLLLRFNQNVSRRSGAYFDNCLDLISNWSETPSLQNFSFVRDPPLCYERENEKDEGILQSIIVSNLSTIDNFSVPATDLSAGIFTTDTIGLSRILGQFRNLEYLIVDRSNLIFPVRSGRGFEPDLEEVDRRLRLIGCDCSRSPSTRAIVIATSWNFLNKLYLDELRSHKANEYRSTWNPADVPPLLDSTDHSGSSSAARRKTVGKSARRKKVGRSAYVSTPREKEPIETTTVKTESFSAEPASSTTLKIPMKNQRIPEKVTIIPPKFKLKGISTEIELLSSSYPTEVEVQEEKKIRECWNHRFTEGWVHGLHHLTSRFALF